MGKLWGAAVIALVAAMPASAEGLRDLCPDRPGLDTPACTVDAGHLQLEAGIVDWTRDSQPDARTDTILVGDWLARYGIGPSTEVRFGWTTYGQERDRDRTTGAIEKSRRVGDVTLGIKQNLVNPDGDGFSVALLPTVSLPVGRQPIGAGTWAAGLVVPVSWEIVPDVHLQFSPEADAAANESGHGRHLAAGATAGIDFALTKAIDVDFELQAIRDRDPAGHQTTKLAAVSLAYQVGANLQLDVGTVAGLGGQSPDIEAYCGIVRRF